VYKLKEQKYGIPCCLVELEPGTSRSAHAVQHFNFATKQCSYFGGTKTGGAWPLFSTNLQP